MKPKWPLMVLSSELRASRNTPGRTTDPSFRVPGQMAWPRCGLKALASAESGACGWVAARDLNSEQNDNSCFTLSIYIPLYIHIYICTSIHTCTYTYKTVAITTHVEMCMYMCIYSHVYMRNFKSIHLHMHTYICICIYIYVCICPSKAHKQCV